MGKKNKKRRFKIRHFLILLIIVYVVSTIISQQKTMRNLKAEKEKKENKIIRLEQEIDEINEEIKKGESLEFIEKVARDELKMVKPREIIYVDKNKLDNPFLKSRKP